MKCVLIRPPFEKTGFDQDYQESVGLGYLASSLRSQGIAVVILDGELSDLDSDAIVNFVGIEKPDVAGFSLMSLYSVPEAVRIAEKIKNSSLSDIHLTAGGYLASFSPEYVFKKIKGLDSIIRFEGEFRLPLLVRNASQGMADKTPGVTFFNHDSGKIFSTPDDQSLMVKDLDLLQVPSRDMMPMVIERGLPVSISGSRGCIGNCSFCSVKAFYNESCGKSLRFRAIDSVVNEIEQIHSYYGSQVFHFIDDDFIGNRAEGFPRAARFAELIIEKKLNIIYNMECRCDLVDRDLFSLLSKSGLSVVFLGIDSVVPSTLSLYGKHYRRNAVEDSLDILRGLGIEIEAGYIPFHPFVSFNDIVAEFNFLKSNNIATIHSMFNRLYCTPELRVTKTLCDAGLLRTDDNIRYEYDFIDPGVKALYAIAEVAVKPFFDLWYDVYKTRRIYKNRLMLKIKTGCLPSSMISDEKKFSLIDEKFFYINRRITEHVNDILSYLKNRNGPDILAFSSEIKKSLSQIFAEHGNVNNEV